MEFLFLAYFCNPLSSSSQEKILSNVGKTFCGIPLLEKHTVNGLDLGFEPG